MNKISDWFPDVFTLSTDLKVNILSSVIIVLVLWLFRVLALRFVSGRTQDLRIRYRWRKTLTYVTVIFGIVMVGRVWFKGIQSVATFLGLLSAGLAIALKDLIADIAGWVFIIWRRPFEVGDRIQIGENAGDVIDIRVFTFTILEIGNWVDADQSTGRMIQIPNVMVFNHSVANYSKGFAYLWNEIPVPITFESNWKKAKGILQEIANKQLEHIDETVERQIKEASRRFLIFYSVLTPIVYTAVKEYGVMLTIRYICEVRRRRSTAEAIWERILDEFGKCDDIDFAYPTTRFYNNAREGKRGNKPSSLESAE